MQPVVGGWWCANCGEVLHPPDTSESVPDFMIPEGIFGYVPTMLPTLIGKVVMLAALLETKVEGLASSLDNATQDVHGGQGFAVNSTTIRRRLASYESNPVEATFSDEVRELLVDIEAALTDRNFIVHGVWPKSSDFVWWGWKPKRSKKNSPQPEWIEGRTLTPDEFVETCERLVGLLERIQRAIESAGSLPRRP